MSPALFLKTGKEIHREKNALIVGTDELNFSFNLFYTTIPFCTPRKHKKTFGFLTFSGAIERDQWHEMG